LLNVSWEGGSNVAAYQSFFGTALGNGLVIATESGICRVDLPPTTVELGSLIPASDLTRHAACLLERFFKGEQVSFASLPLDLSMLTPFQQQIARLAVQIPYGQVLNYGELAKQAGRPGAARAVGGAMAANPIPVIIPCHRVVSSTGTLTGYSSPGGILMKKNLLSLEGVEFRGGGHLSKLTVLHRNF